MGTRPHLGLFAFKTVTLAPELQVSMGPRPHLWFFAFKTVTLAQQLQVSTGPIPCLWFCAFTTTTLRPELIVSMGRDLTCCFVHAKQCDWHQNYWSLWVPAFICGFCMQNSDFWNRITSLYESQTLTVGL